MSAILRRFLSCLALLLACSAVAQQQLEIIPLRSQTVDRVLPTLLPLVEPGGTLVSASCSYNVRPEGFVRFLASAAHLAGRRAYLEELRGAGPDHPAWLSLPESSYLKCAFVRVE